MSDYRFWYANVFVSDFDRAIDFYSNVLGLPLRFRDDDHGYASFDTDGAGLAVVRANADDLHLVGRHTGIALGVEDINAIYDRLTDRGVYFSLPPTEQPWGGTLALFADPDGNIYYLDQLRDES